MAERINYNNGYYFGDVTTKYINGSFVKVKHGYGTYYWNEGGRLEGTYMDDNVLNGKYSYTSLPLTVILPVPLTKLTLATLDFLLPVP